MSQANSTLSTETAVDEAHSFTELDAIKQALQPYITAAKTGDGALSRLAFLGRRAG